MLCSVSIDWWITFDVREYANQKLAAASVIAEVEGIPNNSVGWHIGANTDA